MANINIMYTKKVSMDLGVEQYSVAAVTKHPDMCKAIVIIDVYDKAKLTCNKISRVGKLFTLDNSKDAFADVVIDNVAFVVLVKTGEMTTALDFSIHKDVPLRVAKGVKICLDDEVNNLRKTLTDNESKHRALSRLKAECGHALAVGKWRDKGVKILTENSINSQIYCMKAIYYSIGEANRPTWTSIAEINAYGQAMCNLVKRERQEQTRA